MLHCSFYSLHYISFFFVPYSTIHCRHTNGSVEGFLKRLSIKGVNGFKEKRRKGKREREELADQQAFICIYHVFCIVLFHVIYFIMEEVCSNHLFIFFHTITLKLMTKAILTYKVYSQNQDQTLCDDALSLTCGLGESWFRAGHFI